jgi:hypothetical protein
VIHISIINKINFLSVRGNGLATQNSTSKLQSEAVIMGYHFCGGDDKWVRSNGGSRIHSQETLCHVVHSKSALSSGIRVEAEQ